MTDEVRPKPFESWAVLELLGHVRTAGKVSEVELFGVKMGRVDVPIAADVWVTQFFGGGSVYRLTPCGEAEARAVAAHSVPQPVHSWEMPRGLPAVQSGPLTLDDCLGEDEEDEDEEEAS